MNKYSNTKVNVAMQDGGSDRVTIASNAGQGSDIPCRMVKLQSSHVDVRVNIGSACTSTTGIQVPQVDQASDVWNILELNIDNLNKLYFYGATNSATIDILYMR